jgi:hypothetical protein
MHMVHLSSVALPSCLVMAPHTRQPRCLLPPAGVVAGPASDRVAVSAAWLSPTLLLLLPPPLLLLAPAGAKDRPAKSAAAACTGAMLLVLLAASWPPAAAAADAVPAPADAGCLLGPCRSPASISCAICSLVFSTNTTGAWNNMQRWTTSTMSSSSWSFAGMGRTGGSLRGFSWYSSRIPSMRLATALMSALCAGVRKSVEGSAPMSCNDVVITRRMNASFLPWSTPWEHVEVLLLLPGRSLCLVPAIPVLPAAERIAAADTALARTGLPDARAVRSTIEYTEVCQPEALTL